MILSSSIAKPADISVPVSAQAHSSSSMFDDSLSSINVTIPDRIPQDLILQEKSFSSVGSQTDYTFVGMLVDALEVDHLIDPDYSKKSVEQEHFSETNIENVQLNTEVTSQAFEIDEEDDFVSSQSQEFQMDPHDSSYQPTQTSDFENETDQENVARTTFYCLRN